MKALENYDHPTYPGGVNTSPTIVEQDMAGAQDTIYLCNFRVSVDGEWLCLKELQDVDFNMQDSFIAPQVISPDIPCHLLGMSQILIFTHIGKF